MGVARVAAFETRSADLPLGAAAPRSGRTHGYDALGRVVAEREVDGSVVRTRYVPLGEQRYDANDTDQGLPHHDTPTALRYDGRERLVEVVERDGSRRIATRYAYDGLDNLVGVTDAAGEVRRYRYDGRARRTGIEDPNAGQWTLRYDDADGLVSRLDPRENQVLFRYDRAGRLVEELHRRGAQGPVRSVVRHHYDAACAGHPSLRNVVGQRGWVEDEAGVECFGYDARGRETGRAQWVERPGGRRIHSAGPATGELARIRYHLAAARLFPGSIRLPASLTDTCCIDSVRRKPCEARALRHRLAFW